MSHAKRRMWRRPNDFGREKGHRSVPFLVSVRNPSHRRASGAQRLRRDRELPPLRRDRDCARPRPLLFRDRAPLRLALFPDRLLLDRFRVEPPPAFRLRVAAALRADAERAALLRLAAARPPFRPPFFVGALLVFRPRPEPDLRPPPDIAFSVAQARRSASSRGTPRLS